MLKQPSNQLEAEEYKFLLPFVKWFGRFLSSFTFGVLIFSLLLSFKSALPEKAFSEIELNLFGDIAMRFISFQIAHATLALIVATLGIVVLIVLQVFFSALLNSKAKLFKHFIFEHLSESLMLIAGAFTAYGMHKWQFQGQALAVFVAYLLLAVLTLLFSFIYSFVMDNENRIQAKVNFGFKEPLKRLGQYLSGHSEKL